MLSLLYVVMAQFIHRYLNCCKPLTPRFKKVFLFFAFELEFISKETCTISLDSSLNITDN